MNQTTETPSLQPSLGSDFEPKSMEQVIEETMVSMYARGEAPDAIAHEVARITKEFSKEAPMLERAAQCPKCRERVGFRTIRSTWLDAGKARERICRNPKCSHFFRTFEPFPKGA